METVDEYIHKSGKSSIKYEAKYTDSETPKSLKVEDMDIVEHSIDVNDRGEFQGMVKESFFSNFEMKDTPNSIEEQQHEDNSSENQEIDRKNNDHSVHFDLETSKSLKVEDMEIVEHSIDENDRGEFQGMAIENSKIKNELEIPNVFQKCNAESENLKKKEKAITPSEPCEKCADLMKKNKELLKKNKILEELNISLQKEVIDKMRGLQITPLTAAAQPGWKPEMPKIGEATNDEVHIGQGIFLKKGTYNSCFVSARSGAQFVKNIAVALFGIDVLRNSSVTGKASNRMKSKDARPSLDPSKLQAIRDIYRHYLLQKGHDEVSLDYDLSKIGTHIASKISDLNRLSRGGTKSSVLKASEDAGSSDSSIE